MPPVARGITAIPSGRLRTVARCRHKGLMEGKSVAIEDGDGQRVVSQGACARRPRGRCVACVMTREYRDGASIISGS